MLNIFPESMNSKEELSIESIASKLVYFQEQLHLLHWQTNIGDRHKALGKLYEYVEGFKDNVVEQLMGYSKRRIKVYKLEPLKQISPEEVIVEMENFSKQLCKFASDNKFSNIENLSQEFSGMVAKTSYLLTMA